MENNEPEELFEKWKRDAQSQMQKIDEGYPKRDTVINKDDLDRLHITLGLDKDVLDFVKLI